MKQCQLKEEDRAELMLLAGAHSVEAENPAALSHLRECSSCADSFAAQAALWNQLDTWTVPDVSSGFNRELYAKIDALSRETWLDRLGAQLKAVFASPSLAIAAAGLLIAGGFVLDHPAGTVQSSQSAQAVGVHAPAIQVSTSEAEQVEKTLDDLEMLSQFGVSAAEKESASKSM